MRFLHALLGLALTWPALVNAQSADAKHHPGVFRPVQNANVDGANATSAVRQAGLDILNRIIDALSCTLLTNITRPVWLPVSRERVLTSIVEGQRKGLQEGRDMMARLKASLPQAITPELRDP